MECKGEDTVEPLKLALGYEIDCLDGIHEGYRTDDMNITANVNPDNMYNCMRDMISILPEPVFFFIEVPCDEKEEQTLKDDSGCFHKKVYYLDNCNHKVARAILKRYGELLFNDGLVTFGFGSHNSDNEIYIKKYNVFSVYSDNIKEYARIFENNNIKAFKNLRTVWDIITEDNAGTCTLIDYNGENIFDIVLNLTDAGLYFSHNTED